MPLDPRAARLLRMLAATGPSGGVATAADRRGDLQALAAAFAGEPPEAETRDLGLDGPGGALPVRRYDPVGGGDGGGVVYLHGGGWVAGGLDTHDGVCRRLARSSGASVFALDYRLAPEHPFPAALDDAEAAVRALALRAGDFGLDPARLALAGDSAGGTLATAAALRLADLRPRLKLLLLICPILDLVGTTPSREAFADGYFLRAEALAADLGSYAGGLDLARPDLSPLRADLRGLPPTRVHVAEFDPFRDEGVEVLRRLEAAGVEARLTEHAGQIHYFYALPSALPQADAALAAAGAELREALAA